MVNAFSFCLYGPESPRYYPGMVENISILQAEFPDWVVYVYIAPDISESMKAFLKGCPSVRVRETSATGAINMVHRFFAIDEDDVDIMMVRDADSRVHWKDRWAIKQFLSTPTKVAHIIRDNRMHTAFMMGGLWGLRKTVGLRIQDEYAAFTNREYGYGHDQNFLTDCIYPKIKDRVLVHYSHDRIFPGESGVPFPFQWSVTCFCGMVEMDQRFMPDHFVEKQKPLQLPLKLRR